MSLWVFAARRLPIDLRVAASTPQSLFESFKRACQEP
jgi:hypothetical protein